MKHDTEINKIKYKVVDRTVLFSFSTIPMLTLTVQQLSDSLNTLRTGLLNCLNARSRGLTFRHRASCI